MDIADRIQTRMSELNLTQEELAIRADISQAMVYKLLSRKAKSTTKIVQLADALECSIEWLAKGSATDGVQEARAKSTIKSITKRHSKKYCLKHNERFNG